MLSMIQQHHIKYLHQYKGLSLRAIARETNHDFKTVKKYAYKEDDNSLPSERKKIKGSKLDPYKPLIDQWLQEDMKAPKKQRHTGARVFHRLKAMFGDDFNVSYRTVQYYVSTKKKELYDANEGYLPLEHSPGTAQVDFGSYTYQDESAGVEKEGYYLNLSFPYSNAGFMQAMPAQNQECLLQGLKQIFEYIGGVPKKIWFDNLSAAVISIYKNGERKLVPQFEKFALHYNFQPIFCNPNSGHEKGHVENKVGYHRRNFLVPIPIIKDMNAFNQSLLIRCEEDMKRPHYRKEKQIATLFEEDKKSIWELPKTSFDVHRLIKARADKYGKVRFEKNRYSTSPSLASQKVWLKITYETIVVLDDEYHMVVEHRRLYGENLESMKWIPYLDLMARRPKSFEQMPFFRELPDPWQDYLSYTSKKKEALRLLSQIIKEEGDIETATQALVESIKLGQTDTDSILTTWYRITGKLEDLPEIQISEHLKQEEVFEANWTSYDQLLGGGVK
ncbi:transposase [Bacillus methanolicus]|uniref:IS21 family transposase n=1 Tax=Bacillus methanolicus TaxID=1471 RepID=UPI002380C1B6|nr:IS21 family transposase [Bacillus methanolicus]MDE3838002.1 transposase [Bacillus methanolicus]MDE3838041.1 transposase [Bacillus methanolicus]